MHKIAEKEFTLEDFSHEHLIDFVETKNGACLPKSVLGDVITALNTCRDAYLETKDENISKFVKRVGLDVWNTIPGDSDKTKRNNLAKKYWWQMIQLLPSSYNQRRTVMLNYEVLANIYKSRKNHKLDEWSGKDCFKDLVRNCNTCVKKETSECHGGKEGGFIQWIESLPYSEIIIGEPEEKKNLKNIQISDEIMEEAKRRVFKEIEEHFNEYQDQLKSGFLNKKLNIPKR